MNLNLHIISAFLTDVATTGQLPEDALTCTLRGVQIYTPEVPCGSDWLYLVPPEESLPTAPAGDVSFFCCAAPAAVPPGAAVLWPLEPLSLTRALAALQGVFQAFQAWEERMEDLLHTDAPLRLLGEASLGFLQNPFALYAPSLRQIFHCESPKPRRLQFFSDDEVDAFLPDEDIDQLKNDTEYVESLHTVEPTVFSERIWGYRILYMNLRIEGRYVARVTVCEIERPFRPCDFPILKAFCRLLTVAFRRQNLIYNTHPPYFDQTVNALLQQDAFSQARLDAALEDLGWRTNDDYFCCIVELSYDRVSHTIAPICSRFESAVSNCMALPDRESILLLINLRANGKTRHKVLSELVYIIRDGLMKLGASMDFSDFLLLPHYVTQARQALHWGKLCDPTVWCYRYEEYSLNNLLYQAYRTAPLEVHCPVCLRRLKAYDKAHHREYAALLKAYLRCDRSTAKTIRAVYLQRATFLYQLQRIQEILQADLEDPDLRLQLLMYFKYEELQSNADLSHN